MKRTHVYLNLQDNTEEVFNFYKSVFGGEFSQVMRFKDIADMAKDLPDRDKDKIMHISLPIGNDTILMATDSLKSQGQKVTFGNSISIMLDTESKEEADKIFEKLSDGGKVEMPMKDEFWGDYFGALTDKFGIPWMIVFGEQI